jgi:predicted AlkP superfamily pyrophosphatase or phosphodiesterase
MEGSRARSAAVLCALALLQLAAACERAPTAREPEPEPVPARPYVLLLSLDGFRPDYLQALQHTTMAQLAERGALAEALVPVFPTSTFPNHYTQVTGLYPERHGIVANSFYDPQRDQSYSLGNRAAVQDGSWYRGEPIWVTAERQGRRSATMFWPGSEAEIGGLRPSTWLDYDGSLPHPARIDSVLAWLDRPAETRPAFVTLYFSTVDSEGHRHGPYAPEVTAALEEVDTALARLVAGLEARGLLDRTDLIVTTDHGMAELDPERVVFLDDYVDLDADVERVTWGAVTGLWPAPGRTDEVVSALRERPHFQAWHREDVPERFHFRDHRRIAPVVLLADEGWTLSTRENTERRGRPSGGTHGFDPELDSMAGVLIARGPSFRGGGAVVRPVVAVDLYNVMAQALGLTPAPNDGDPEVPALLLAR